MRTRRLLFVRPPQSARLTPIYVAFLLLLALSLAGFVIAFWPEEPASSASRSGERDTAPAARSFEGGQHAAPDTRESRGRMTRM